MNTVCQACIVPSTGNVTSGACRNQVRSVPPSMKAKPEPTTAPMWNMFMANGSWLRGRMSPKVE